MCELGTCPNDCDGHGACQPDGSCACYDGFSGVDCSVHACVDDCGEAAGRGMCLRGKCMCASGWSGLACERATCPHGCSGHGLCTAGKCACRAGFSGLGCEIGCLNGCSRRGNCTAAGTCACAGGWRGADCSVAPLALRGCAFSCAERCEAECGKTPPQAAASAADGRRVCEQACVGMCLPECELRAGANGQGSAGGRGVWSAS